MTACCVSGYRPLRDIRPDEATWPPVLAPAGPWEICDCAEGDVVRRVLFESRLLKACVEAGERLGERLKEMSCFLNNWEHASPPICSTCADAIPAAPIKWGENWSAHMCRMCGAILAEEQT